MTQSYFGTDTGTKTGQTTGWAWTFSLSVSIQVRRVPQAIAIAAIKYAIPNKIFKKTSS